MFTSDISRRDVVDMEGVLEEAYELVEHGRLDLAEFCDVTFGHIAELHAGINPAFFDGTVVAEEVLKAARGNAARPRLPQRHCASAPQSSENTRRLRRASSTRHCRARP
jgi:hypothetical protein